MIIPYCIVMYVCLNIISFFGMMWHMDKAFMFFAAYDIFKFDHKDMIARGVCLWGLIVLLWIPFSIVAGTRAFIEMIIEKRLLK
jgi:hypothetical protein